MHCLKISYINVIHVEKNANQKTCWKIIMTVECCDKRAGFLFSVFKYPWRVVVLYISGLSLPCIEIAVPPLGFPSYSHRHARVDNITHCLVTYILHVTWLRGCGTVTSGRNEWEKKAKYCCPVEKILWCTWWKTLMCTILFLVSTVQAVVYTLESSSQLASS
jgi:hypothetical protein